MTAESWYHAGARQLQDELDSRRMADRLAERVVHTTITPDDRTFIEAAPMFFLATADAAGHPDCSHKGGLPGFVRVEDESTLTFPDFDGNGMFRSLGNIVANPHVGLLFISFTRPRRLRLNGTATLHRDDATLARHPGAQLVVRVRADHVFPNCPRYIHNLELAEHSVYVPRPDRLSPAPEWKSTKDWQDVLPRRGVEALSAEGRAAAQLRGLRWAQRKVVRLRKGVNWGLRQAENRLGETALRRAVSLGLHPQDDVETTVPPPLRSAPTGQPTP